jgi:RNase P subunit RPR2
VPVKSRVPHMFCHKCETFVPVIRAEMPMRGPQRWLAILLRIDRLLGPDIHWYCTQCGARQRWPSEIMTRGPGDIGTWTTAVRRAVERTDARDERGKRTSLQ